LACEGLALERLAEEVRGRVIKWGGELEPLPVEG